LHLAEAMQGFLAEIRARFFEVLYTLKPCVRSTRFPANVAKDSEAHFSRKWSLHLSLAREGFFGTGCFVVQL